LASPNHGLDFQAIEEVDCLLIDSFLRGPWKQTVVPIDRTGSQPFHKMVEGDQQPIEEIWTRFQTAKTSETRDATFECFYSELGMCQENNKTCIACPLPWPEHH